MLSEFITKLLCEKDFMNLMVMGCPPDEYETEAVSICKRIDLEESLNVELLAYIIWDVFRNSFCIYHGTQGSIFRETIEGVIEIVGEPRRYKNAAYQIIDFLTHHRQNNVKDIASNHF